MQTFLLDYFKYFMLDSSGSARAPTMDKI